MIVSRVSNCKRERTVLHNAVDDIIRVGLYVASSESRCESDTLRLVQAHQPRARFRW
jgi:hypothetical protein